MTVPDREGVLSSPAGSAATGEGSRQPARHRAGEERQGHAVQRSRTKENGSITKAETILQGPAHSTAQRTLYRIFDNGLKGRPGEFSWHLSLRLAPRLNRRETSAEIGRCTTGFKSIALLPCRLMPPKDFVRIQKHFHEFPLKTPSSSGQQSIVSLLCIEIQSIVCEIPLCVIFWMSLAALPILRIPSVGFQHPPTRG